ncbi:MAG: hypothetical protein BAA01_08410 [Bacillus thermozeamaize]|jgi:phosphoesterase RecJ-like protein|uniref:Exopolyphosphatase n=1 Tax=Bacillus thermozeamaize TaxID=230954 RepID=A0A1Y3PM28_9BACI|nr:MAG: hypothetical protein BAA01_08410 [Bacillus thermozeamaize]
MKTNPDMMQLFREAARFISEHDQFLVISHLSPDGDAIGSTLAMVGILKALKKRYCVVNPDRLPKKYGILPWADEILSSEERGTEGPYHHVIALDCADEKRMEPFPSRFAAGARILNIDHHPTNTRYGTVNLVLPEAAATAQLVYYLAETLQVPLEEPLATCLYTGILTDTGGFRYSNTKAEVMRIASRLLDAGVNPGKLAEQFLERISEAHLHVLQKALSRLQREMDGRLAWMYVTQEDLREAGATEADMDGLVQYPLRIEGVEVGLLFREMSPASCKVSLRSRERVDVAKIAGLFGGGGHARAAGCTVEGPLLAVMEQVRASVQKELLGGA